MRGEIIDIGVDRQYLFVCVRTSRQHAEAMEKLKDTDVDFEIKKHREKRSLNANSYCWKLIRDISNAIGVPEDDVYEEMLRTYGQSTVIKVSAEVPMREYYKHVDEMQTVTQNGEEYTFYRVYKGSSEMNTQEMAKLIDGVIYEAKGLGLQVLTPDEARLLKERWNIDE